jgi:uncharacterized coiled-coil protein SlyX
MVSPYKDMVDGIMSEEISLENRIVKLEASLDFLETLANMLEEKKETITLKELQEALNYLQQKIKKNDN